MNYEKNMKISTNLVHEQYIITKESSTYIALLKLNNKVNIQIYTPVSLRPGTKLYKDPIRYTFDKKYHIY